MRNRKLNILNVPLFTIVHLKGGFTPLHLASAANHLKTTSLLIASGASLKAVSLVSETQHQLLCLSAVVLLSDQYIVCRCTKLTACQMHSSMKLREVYGDVGVPSFGLIHVCNIYRQILIDMFNCVVA